MQWLISERQKKSVIPPLFWSLSLWGSLSLVLHTLIQLQYPLSIIQGCNSVFAWRNMNLQKPVEKQATLQRTLLFLTGSICLITFLFFAQTGSFDWVRIPKTPWQQEAESVSVLTHTIGSLGIILFGLRFWLQWWSAERGRRTEVHASFWWLSLIGSALSLHYFIAMGDLVNILGYSFGAVPYIRNLFLEKNRHYEKGA